MARLSSETAYQEVMDHFIEKLADALRREFPFLDGPNTAPDAFRKTAAGIVEKMGLDVEHGPSMPIYFFKEDAQL